MEKKKTVHRKKKKMKPKLTFKFSVVIAIFLLSLSVCFLIFMFKANTDDKFLDKIIGTSDESVTYEKSDNTNADEKETNMSSKETSDLTVKTSITNPVPQSETADDTYFVDCCLITDATLTGMKGKGFSEDAVYGSDDMNVGNATIVKIESSFGTLSPYEIVKQKKPATVYLMFGKELETADVETIIASYTTLVNSLKSAVPEIKICVMQYPPVLYDSDTLTNEMVNDYNNRLLTMCNSLEVYCIDTNTALKSESGKLDESYWSYETLTLSDKGYDKVREYILTHTVL